jgi:hypothetical protein
VRPCETVTRVNLDAGYTFFEGETMRVAHFDCFSGVSGDMILGALLDVGVDEAAIRAGLNSFGLPMKLEVERVKRGGFVATKATIVAEDEREYRFLPQVEAILAAGALTERQRQLARQIFQRLAEAEAAAHGMPLERVHFHEVGALDSIADIAGAAIGLDLLGVEQFTSRSVPTGIGSVQCAHGIMPIPTPATARLLLGVPLAPSTVKFELTTPTGAAILTSVVTEWTEAPAMTIERIGCGAGTKDFIDSPNLLRLFVGTSADAVERVTVLETNLDDVPAEVIGYCIERLLVAGALDVFAVPIQMKKQRPGVLLTVLASADKVAVLEALLFRETGTFGVRKTVAERTTLRRARVTLTTPWGSVAGKRGTRPDGSTLVTPEYEDCARIARQQGVPLREVLAAARLA